MGILRRTKSRAIYNYKHCIAVDLILKHNQTGTMLGRVQKLDRAGVMLVVHASTLNKTYLLL